MAVWWGTLGEAISLFPKGLRVAWAPPLPSGSDSLAS